jgi:hypothetical protein
MRMRFVFVLSLIAMSLIGVPSSGAQATGWQVTVFDSQTSSFSTITASGIQPGPALPGLQNFQQVYAMKLSPDGTFAVFSGSQANSQNSGTYVANLATGTCCVQLQDPSQPAMQTTYVGPFSPDGSQIVSSMLDMNSLGQGQTPSAEIAVFDLASGSVVASTPLSSIPGQTTYTAAVAFGEWKPDGIRVVPSCWGCEGVWNGTYSIWNPATNTVSAPVEPFDIFLEKLPATGEMVKIAANTDYPQSGAPGGYFPPSNVVEYFTAVDQSGQVIYFNPANPYVMTADWVYDGKAILVQHAGPVGNTPESDYADQPPSDAYLLFRDGHQVSVPANLGHALTATPDGWIASDYSTGAVSLVKVDDNGNLQVASLGNGAQWTVAWTNFTLGASATASPFPTVPPPAQVTCPGFVQSRLWPDTYAQVSPGVANNLRADATTSSAQIGTIPGGGVFAVLDGPVCAENMAWWQVQYQGQIGWTAEGQGSTYWLVPMSDVTN